MLMQVPPYISRDFSTTSTSSPCWARNLASVFPPLPKPIMMFCTVFIASSSLKLGFSLDYTGKGGDVTQSAWGDSYVYVITRNLKINVF